MADDALRVRAAETKDSIASADELLERIRKYNPGTRADLIRDAYAYAEEKHRDQLRRSGDPYFSHPVAVANYLIEKSLDDELIATALLHDTVEDTPASVEEISDRFGEEIARAVSGVTKLKDLRTGDDDESRARNLRKFLQAAEADARVLLVKLADRLHNMRTIRHLPKEKQVAKAQETLDIFAPLAGRIGMQSWQEDLEDWAFKVLQPEARNSVLRGYAALRKQAGQSAQRPEFIIHQFGTRLKSLLEERGIEADVRYRLKTPYSIWRKSERKDGGVESLFDVYGIRIITETADGAYRALGAVHSEWHAIPGRFKDYISLPKSNGYRSIHTTVSASHGFRVEIQIRTADMHKVAETGIAAHWAYRLGRRDDNPYVPDFRAWLKSLKIDLPDHVSPAEYMDHVKLPLAPDRVFCFTPKGEVVRLPVDATPIDFAYAIHTDIGDKCVGARINGMIKPLSTALRNGQTVEIVTTKDQQTKLAWLDSVKTARAKSAIRRSVRVTERIGRLEQARKIFDGIFQKLGLDPTNSALAKATEIFGLKDSEEFLLRLENKEIKAESIAEAVHPEYFHHPRIEAENPAAPVVGLEGASGAIAECCQPVPGDTIYGIPSGENRFDVHAFDCDVLSEREHLSNWKQLHWHPGPHPAIHESTLEIVMQNRPSVLGRVCTLIGEQNSNISDLRLTDRKPDYYNMLIEIQVRHTRHLHAIIESVEADDEVLSATRFRTGATA